MSHIITIAGSPAGSMKSSAILNHTQRLLRRRFIHNSAIIAHALPPDDLVYGQSHSPAIQEAHLALDQAQGVIIATPIYRSACCGVLKTFLDLLPPNAFQGKIVLPIATGGSSTELFALDYTLHPVLAALGASHILPGVTITDEQIQFEHGGALRLEECAEQRLRGALEQLVANVQSSTANTALIDWNIISHRRSGAHYTVEPDYLLEGFER